MKSTTAEPAAKLADLKKNIEENSAAAGVELFMTLQTGVITVVQPQTSHSRSRSRGNKLQAKRKQHSNVNPHERIKNVLVDQSSKRPRDVGGTPPSITQPSKKSLSITTDTGVVGINPKQARNQKKKEKKRLNKLLGKIKSTASNQTVDFKALADKSVPPLPLGAGLSGSGESANAENQLSASDPATMHNRKTSENDTSEKPPSYAQVTDNLCVAVIDQRQVGQMQLLDQKRFDKLNTQLTDIIMAMIGKNTELPVFDDTRLHGGDMRIRCANAHTRKWLETNIPKLDAKKLWPGAKMVVMDFRDLPKPHKFNVVFCGIIKSPKVIFRLLETQNKGITTKSWSVLNCRQRDGVTYMTIGVGQDSFETLRTRSNSLYCGMGKATFTIVKSCKEHKSI